MNRKIILTFTLSLFILVFSPLSSLPPYRLLSQDFPSLKDVEDEVFHGKEMKIRERKSREDSVSKRGDYRSITPEHGDVNDLDSYCDIYLTMKKHGYKGVDFKMVLNDIMNIVEASEDIDGSKSTVSIKLNLSGQNRNLWMEKGILIVSGNKQMTPDESELIRRSLDVFPSEISSSVRAVISMDEKGYDPKGEQSGWTWEDDSGIICINDLDKYHNKNKESYINTFMHETAHVLEHTGFINKQQLAKRDRLWDASEKGTGDFISSYAETSRKEDLAETFARYTSDTIDFYARALMQFNEGKSDILLKKLELISDIYKYTREGKEYTYIYDTTHDGKITKKEIPLKTYKIQSKEYVLPDASSITYTGQAPVFMRRLPKEVIINKELEILQKD
ncbi:MAG: hypothetical protein JW827_00975 [Spirochaetes bacterium]|nr:hypothetical protein [Spirochaetota bacterium]